MLLPPEVQQRGAAGEKPITAVDPCGRDGSCGREGHLVTRSYSTAARTRRDAPAFHRHVQKYFGSLEEERNTHISTREGGEELELFEGESLGGHKVEEDLQLAAAEEAPFQELAAWRADSQFADLLR